jgi:streptogrisin C
MTAGLAVTVLAGTAATAAAQGPADEKEALDAAVSAYQRVYPKISPDAARRGAEQQDVRKSLYDELVGKDGSTFGGAWFDPPTGVLHIAATDDATAKRAQELGRAKGLNVAPHLVKRNFDQLVKLAEAVQSPDTELGKAARGNVGLEVESNLVVAAVPASQVDALARSAPEGVRVVADPGEKDEADAGCTSRFACDYTIRSGVAIWRGSKGNNVCSAGFTARNSYNTRFTYTAGHCSSGNGVTWGTGNESIGPMHASMNWWFVDAAIIRVTNPWFTGDHGGEIYREASVGRSANVNGAAPTLSYIWEGDVTCLSANITQANGPNFCGVVTSNMDWGKRGLVRVSGLDACPGDSGGGWYWLTSTGRRIAYGMHSRSHEGCHGNDGGSRSWFSALPVAKAFVAPTLNVEIRP